MSSPPQLHLTLPSNTTSFKRSFEQFGFDLESPVGGPEAGSSGSGSSGRSDNGRNSRNKRARSASSLSDGNDSLRSSTSSSTFTSGSSVTSFGGGSGTPGSSAVVSAVSPPRIPTPDIQDIEMPDYRQDEVQPRASSEVSPTVSSDESYRTSLDGRSTSRATTTLRRSPSLPRSPTPPPTLPPLHLEDSTPSVPFLDSTVRPSSSVSENTYLPRRTADVPPRLPSPVQHSASLSEPFYPLETDSEPFHSASHAHISLDVSPQSPSSSVESGSDAIDLQDNTETNAVAEPSFTERLNAALDTGDIASFRERVSSAFDAFRNNNNRAYDDLGESSSSTATVRPRSSASTSSGSRSGSRPTAVLSVIIPNSSILSSSTPASPAVPTPVISGLSQLSDNSASNDNTMNAAMPPFRRPVAQAQESRGLAYRGFFDAAFPRSASDSDSPQFGVESVLGSGAVSHTLSSPSRLSPIQFLDPVWDLDGDRLTANTAGGSNSTNVSASRSTVERVPNWRQLPRPSSAQPDHQRRSLPAGGLRRRSSFSRDFARWFEDSSSDTDPASRTGAGLTNYDDTSAEEDDRPVIPVIPGLFEFYPSELRTSNSRTNAANVLTRNAGHSARTSEDRDQDDLILQSRARRLISQGLLDPRERDSVRRSLTERRRESESEAERNRRERAQRIPERSELRRPIPDWQFSWNDAFERVRRERERREREYDVETDLGGWGNMDVDHDDNPRDDTDSGQELSESERIYQRSRRMGPRAPGSFLFDSGDSDRRLQSRPFSFNLDTPDLGRAPNPLASGLRRPRPRIYGPRPGASNSLLTENAAEIRRRNARAELTDQYSSRILSSASDEPSASSTSTFVPALNMRRRYSRNEHGTSQLGPHTSRFPVLPPLPYEYRIPSPPILSRSLVEVMDSVDRETQHQESLEEESSRPLTTSDRRRLRSRIRNDPSFARLNRGDQDSDMDVESHLDPVRRVTNTREERQRRLERLLRETHSSQDESSRTHSHSSSWSHSNEGRTRSREDPDGFFDSQSSSISDIARTITGNGDLDSPVEETERRINENRPEIRSVWRSGLTGHAPGLSRHHRSLSNPPPSIPPPDLGDPSMFIPVDIPDDMLRPAPEMPWLQRGSNSTSGNVNEGLSSSVAPPPSQLSAPSLSYRPGSGPFSNPSGHTQSSSTRGGIDVDSLAPGPFRTTMQRMVEQGRLRNSRPQIPPLTFEDDFESLSNMPTSLRTSDFVETRIPRPSHVHRNSSVSHESSREPSSNLNRRTSLPSSSARDPHPFQRRPSNEGTGPDRRQRLDELHRMITNHARIDASLLHGPDMPSRQPTSAPGESEGFNHAIEVLRHDGLSEARSQQLIDRYHRERSVRAPSPSSSLWGTLEDDTSTFSNTRPWRNSRGSTPGSFNPGSIGGSDFSGRTARRHSPTRPFDRAETSQDNRSRGSRMFFGLRNPNSTSFRDDLFNEMLLPPRRSRHGTLSFGDFMRDEDFDGSYESLTLLTAALGDVKPRGTPDHVIAGLDTAFFKDWVTEDCDKRCPICLDDYKALDPVLKLKECSHWLHKPCLEQWLKGAATCPVCRKSVVSSPSPFPSSSAAALSSSSSLSNPNSTTAGGGGIPPEAPLRWRFHHLRRGPRRPLDTTDTNDSNSAAEAESSRSRTNNDNPSSSLFTSTSPFRVNGLRPNIHNGGDAGNTDRSNRGRRHSGEEVPRTEGSPGRSGNRSGNGNGAGNGSTNNVPSFRNSRPAWGRYMP